MITLNKQPKILLSCPTAKVKDYCYDDWKQLLKAMTYPNLDILIVDNSKDLNYQDKIRQDFNCVHLDPEPKNQLTHVKCLNYIRDVVIKSDYDYWFSLESDQFPPVNIIEHLLTLKVPVSCIPYFTGVGEDSFLLVMEDEGFGRKRKSLVMTIERAFQFIDGTVKEAYCCGIGCMLVHRSLLKKVTFRFDEKDPSVAHPDSYFHNDLKKLGIPVFMDTSIISEHRNMDWNKMIKEI